MVFKAVVFKALADRAPATRASCRPNEAVRRRRTGRPDRVDWARPSRGRREKGKPFFGKRRGASKTGATLHSDGLQIALRKPDERHDRPAQAPPLRSARPHERAGPDARGARNDPRRRLAGARPRQARAVALHRVRGRRARAGGADRRDDPARGRTGSRRQGEGRGTRPLRPRPPGDRGRLARCARM